MRFQPTAILLALALLAAPALAQPIIGQGEKPLRTIAVSGTVTKKVMPDVIVWHITVTETHPDLERASQACERSIRNVLTALDELDIEEKDIETGVLDVQRIFERDRYGNTAAFRHFQVRRTVVARQRDLSGFDAFYKALLKAAEVELNFTLEASNIEEVRYEARLEALRTAKKKAGDLAAVVDAKLGQVLTIQEAFTPIIPLYNQRAANFAMAIEAAPGGEGGAADAESGTFAPGAIEVKVTVNAVFELE